MSYINQFLSSLFHHKYHFNPTKIVVGNDDDNCVISHIKENDLILNDTYRCIKILDILVSYIQYNIKVKLFFVKPYYRIINKYNNIIIDICDYLPKLQGKILKNNINDNNYLINDFKHNIEVLSKSIYMSKNKLYIDNINYINTKLLDITSEFLIYLELSTKNYTIQNININIDIDEEIINMKKYIKILLNLCEFINELDKFDDKHYCNNITIDTLNKYNNIIIIMIGSISSIVNYQIKTFNSFEANLDTLISYALLYRKSFNSTIMIEFNNTLHNLIDDILIILNLYL